MMDPALLLTAEQSSLLQNPQVLGDGRKRNVEGAGKLLDGRFPLREAVQDCATGRVGEGGEDRVEGIL